tara:strand:- start:148 stop:1227 length:1080 start_codon:yes stop_codon:yes gene_type:complete
MIKKYHKYLTLVFFSNLAKVSLVFFSLSFLLNIFEEIKFFEYIEVSVLLPIGLTLLNIPTIFFELLPFVFLIASMFFFIYLNEKNELIILKNNGINNAKIIFNLCFVTLLFGLFLIFAYYTFSSNLKNTYLNLKNTFSNENEFLAVVNENGLWLREDLGNYVNIINAKTFKEDIITKITISHLDKNYNIIETIISEKANIKSKEWILENVKIYNPNESNVVHKKFNYFSSFNGEIISKLFSNLNSLNLFQLHNQIKNYNSLGYSSTNAKVHLNKIYSLPINLVLMTIIGSILMLKFKFIKSKFFMLVIGVFFSVIIYYINYFSTLFGTNETVPAELSIWLPLVILVLICFLGLIKINEK